MSGTSELARRIRFIQIFTRRAVDDILAGEYLSVFKGRGMEFDEVREYAPGDEVRLIDWNVTARTGHPFVKRYVEERELTVFLAVDLSASGLFGSVNRRKSEVAAELCALLAFSAIRNNDKVGLLLFSERVERFIPPRKGASHVLRIIREVLDASPAGRGTDLALTLDFLGRVARKRGVVFLLSDFLAPDFARPLGSLARRHDLIAVSILDRRELSLPRLGLMALSDPETGRTRLVDTSDPAFQAAYERRSEERRRGLERLFGSLAVDHIPIVIRAGDGRRISYVDDLVRFFKQRERRR
ncbi:MAG: DUF58 domain-containing protein [Desulfobacteraceae bacterium]|nr:DUF58 domain-containing protein [Desulfobacteraceae bacterium]